MEKNSLAVLEYIVANAREGQATVFGAEELTAALPDGGAEGVSVIPVVKELALNNLIRLKYSDGRNVCVEPLEKGILIVEKEQKTLSASSIPTAETSAWNLSKKAFSSSKKNRNAAYRQP